MQMYPAKMRAKRMQPSGRVSLLASALLAAVLPQATMAQDGGEVTLRFASGQDSLSGTLQDFKDDKFMIETNLGLLAIPNTGVVCIGAACPEGTGLEIENARVTLVSKDGSVTIEGDFLEIADGKYVLATAVGEQRVDIAMVDCTGEGCVGGTETAAAEDQGNGLASGEVELFNGAITLIGELIDVQDGSFVLNERSMGEIRVSTADFECTGRPCP